MRHVAASLIAALLLCAPSGLRAGDMPVVVELFTSQGCNACPPADAFMAHVAAQEGVIALSLHVDYWDYLGWKDQFADPAFTARQRKYAHAKGSRMIYTPQMIINGTDHVVGYRPKEVARLIQKHAAAGSPVRLEVTRIGGGRLLVRAEGTPPGEAVVQLVTYLPRATVEIERGENAGRRVDYVNIVTSWTVIGTWDDAKPLSIEAPAPDGEPAVILLQKTGGGAIFGAARVE